MSRMVYRVNVKTAAIYGSTEFLVLARSAGDAENRAVVVAKRDGYKLPHRPIATRVELVGELRN